MSLDYPARMSFLLIIIGFCESFCPIQPRLLQPTRPGCPSLFANVVSITTPSQEDAASMGIREWPQQTKSAGSWSETVEDGKTLVRYVLDGTGVIRIDDGQASAVGPGTLIEVEGRATLEWRGKEDMIILTPGYEESGLLIGVAALLVILTVVTTSLLN